jgi:hypothetical protein
MPEPLWTVLGAVSAGFIVHLWARRHGSAAGKAVWSLALLVPALGPLFYLAMYEAPGEQADDLQAVESDTEMESSRD